METHGDVDEEDVLDRAVVQDLAEVGNELQDLFLHRHMLALERVVDQWHHIWRPSAFSRHAASSGRQRTFAERLWRRLFLEQSQVLEQG